MVNSTVSYVCAIVSALCGGVIAQMSDNKPVNSAVVIAVVMALWAAANRVSEAIDRQTEYLKDETSAAPDTSESTQGEQN